MNPQSMDALRTTSHGQIQKQSLSLESGMMSNAVHHLFNFLETDMVDLASAKNSLLESLSVATKNMVTNIGYQSKFFKASDDAVRDGRWVDISELVVSVPEAFKGDLATYANAIVPQMSVLYNDLMSALKVYKVDLSSFLTDRDYRTGMTKISDSFTRVGGSSDAVRETVRLYFTGGNYAKDTLHNVLPTPAHLSKFTSVINSINAKETINNTTRVKVAMDEVTDLLTKVVKRYDDHEIDNVSGVVAVSMSDATKYLADAVYAYSVGAYCVAVLITTHERLLESIAKK